MLLPGGGTAEWRGKTFVSLYSEDLDGKDAGSKYSLPPIPRNAVDANIADLFSEESANSAEKSANSAPYNNIIIKKKTTTTTTVLSSSMIIVRLILFWLLRSGL